MSQLDKKRIGTGANPFSDSSKSFHFYPSQSHRRGVHRITRGLRSACGLILLIGEIGIGKTTLARHVQSSCRREFAFAELGNPYLTPNEQLHFLCSRFKVNATGLTTTDDYVQALRRCFVRLLEQGRPPVVVLDESHLLDRAHFGLLLILSNLRHEEKPLVQILLVGQMELLERLAEPGLEAMNQRIGVRCELAPLNREDTGRYIQFKLHKAGHLGRSPFTYKAVARIWEISGGLPRLINHACSHALDHAGFAGKTRITPDNIERVYRDPLYTGLFRIRTQPERRTRRAVPAIAATVLCLVLAGFFFWFRFGAGVGEKSPDNQMAHNMVRMAPEPAPDMSQLLVEPRFSARDDADMGTPVVVEEAGSGMSSQTGQTDIGSVKFGPAVLNEGSRNNEERVGTYPVPEPGSPVNALSVDAVAWDKNPDKRMAIINGTILHAGDAIMGIRLHAITPNGLVLEYDGKLYERDAPGADGQ